MQSGHKGIGLLLLGLLLSGCVTATPTSLPVTQTPIPVTQTPIPATPTSLRATPVRPTATPTPALIATVMVTPELSPIYPPVTGERHSGFRQVAALPVELGRDRVRLEALPEGDLLLSTAQGMAIYRDGAWGNLFLDSSWLWIGLDGEGRLWQIDPTGAEIGYQQDGGEFTPAATGWLPVAEPKRLRDQQPVTDHLGRVWLATATDVRYFDGVRWTAITRKEMGMLPAEEPDYLTEFTIVNVPEYERIWVGACDWGGPGPAGGGGARWLNEVAWRGSQTEVAEGCVTTIAADRGGHVWVGMDHGVVADFDQATGKWRLTNLPMPEGVRRGYPVALNVATGRPWVMAALCGGASCDVARELYRLDDGIWEDVPGWSEQPESAAYWEAELPLGLDREARPWLFLSGLVLRMDDDGALVPYETGELEPLAGTVDAVGQVWLVAQRGTEVVLWVLEGENP